VGLERGVAARDALAVDLAHGIPVPRLERRERERHPVLLGGCPCLPNGDSGPSAAASCPRPRPRPRPGPMVQNTTAGRSNFVIQSPELRSLEKMLPLKSCAPQVMGQLGTSVFSSIVFSTASSLPCR